MATPDPRPVLAEFLPPASIRSIQPLGNAGGFSGSLLWRIEASAGGLGGLTSQEYCLRRWPEGTHRERAVFIHTVLTHVAAQGIDFVPAPLPTQSVSEGGLLKSNAYLWDLAPWLPGKADYHANPTRTRLAAAMQALARLHGAIASLGISSPLTGEAPAITERLEQVAQLLSGGFDCVWAPGEQDLQPDLDLRARQILAEAPRHLQGLADPLEAASRERLVLMPAIRDVHADHVLFTGEAVTGLVDFGAMRIDTPLADVARLVGSLAGDDQEARDFALNAYAQVRPLSERDRQLIDLLDHSGVILGGLNWLRWLYVERRDMGPLPPIIKRLDEIIARLVA